MYSLLDTFEISLKSDFDRHLQLLKEIRNKVDKYGIQVNKMIQKTDNETEKKILKQEKVLLNQENVQE